MLRRNLANILTTGQLFWGSDGPNFGGGGGGGGGGGAKHTLALPLKFLGGGGRAMAPLAPPVPPPLEGSTK